MSKTSDTKPAQSALSRRHLFAGAGAAGALAVVAAALPTSPVPEPVAQAKLPEPEAGGYQLTEHVKRYYQTARV
jgi:hypothetical protein